MAEGLTQQQQKILIEYCEKINNLPDSYWFNIIHRDFLTNPKFEFLEHHIPKKQDDWKKFLSIINNIKHREATDYRKKYESNEEPAYRHIRDNEGQPQQHLTPHQFIKAAFKCNSPDEYKTLYNANIANFTKVSIRPFTPELIGLFNEGADVPVYYRSNYPSNLAQLYEFADKNLCDVHNSIPTPEDIAANGLEYLHEIDRQMEENKQVEFHRKDIAVNRQPETEKEKEAKSGEKLIKTFATNAFIAGTLVPPFVMKTDDKVIDFTGFQFEEKKGLGAVVLSKGDRKVLIDSSFYNSIIENSKILANAPAVTPEVIAKYERAAELDREKMRTNTASNFWHNYCVMCRQNANNISDAMKIAAEIVSKMPLGDQLHLKREIKKYNSLTGSKNGYNDRLVNFYEKNVKDLPVTRSIFTKESPQLVSDNYHDVIQKSGELVDKNSKVKIGDLVKMTFDFDDISTGKTRKLPPREYVITAASEDKNKIVLVDKENLSKYVLSRDEFLERRRKQEKVIDREQRKERKKEMKSSLAYSY